MSDEYYRLEKSWTKDQFPVKPTNERLCELNEVLPQAYIFFAVPNPAGEDRIELYEYVGVDLDE